VLTGRSRRANARRDEARELREQARSQDVTVQRREAEAAEAQAKARAARAEADARAAQAAQLQADAQERAEHARASRGELDEQLRRADEIDPDATPDDGTPPERDGAHRVTAAETAPAATEPDADSTVHGDQADAELADRRAADQRQVGGTDTASRDELAARDAATRRPDEELHHVDLTEAERLEQAHTHRDRPYGTPATCPPRRDAAAPNRLGSVLHAPARGSIAARTLPQTGGVSREVSTSKTSRFTASSPPTSTDPRTVERCARIQSKTALGTPSGPTSSTGRPT
jgi:hypothetical protein